MDTTPKKKKKKMSGYVTTVGTGMYNITRFRQ